MLSFPYKRSDKNKFLGAYNVDIETNAKGDNDEMVKALSFYVI